MAYTFDDANAPSGVGHSTSRWAANRAIYNDGWVACTTPPSPHGPVSGSRSTSMNTSGNCYRVSEDFTQAVNRREGADETPRASGPVLDRSREVQRATDRQPACGTTGRELRPSPTAGRSVFTYYAGQTRIPEGLGAPTLKTSPLRSPPTW